LGVSEGQRRTWGTRKTLGVHSALANAEAFWRRGGARRWRRHHLQINTFRLAAARLTFSRIKTNNNNNEAQSAPNAEKRPKGASAFSLISWLAKKSLFQGKKQKMSFL